MLEHLENLCRFVAPSGCEDAVREYISDIALKYRCEIKTDSMGNLLVFKRGESRREKP